MNPTTRQLRQTRARIEAERERQRVVNEYAASLVEVRVVRYRRERSRPEMHRAREARR